MRPHRLSNLRDALAVAAHLRGWAHTGAERSFRPLAGTAVRRPLEPERTGAGVSGRLVGTVTQLRQGCSVALQHDQR